LGKLRFNEDSRRGVMGKGRLLEAEGSCKGIGKVSAKVDH